MFPEKGFLNICSKFAGEYVCRSLISIKLLCTYEWVLLENEIFEKKFTKSSAKEKGVGGSENSGIISAISEKMHY